MKDMFHAINVQRTKIRRVIDKDLESFVLSSTTPLHPYQILILWGGYSANTRTRLHRETFSYQIQSTWSSCIVHMVVRAYRVSMPSQTVIDGTVASISDSDCHTLHSGGSDVHFNVQAAAIRNVLRSTLNRLSMPGTGAEGHSTSIP